MNSDQGVVSLPFKLAISMLVISLAVPLCLQSLNDTNALLGRNAAVGIAERISRTVSELSMRPAGESRLLMIGDGLHGIGPGMSIVVGDVFDGENFSMIRCKDPSGWTKTIAIDLSPEIRGLCSGEFLPLSLDRYSGDILIAHKMMGSAHFILLEAR